VQRWLLLPLADSCPFQRCSNFLSRVYYEARRRPRVGIAIRIVVLNATEKT
jgi:hypothetical protein